MSVMDLKKHCERISPDLLRDITKTQTGSPDWFKIEPLKAEVEQIRLKFLTPGSDTELNIPAKILKPLLTHLDEKKNVHPEIFDAAIDNVLTMLRLSSFPVFCKSALAKGEAKLRPTLQAVLEDLTKSPYSLQDFRGFLAKQNLEGNLEFALRIKNYKQICGGLPHDILASSKTLTEEHPHYQTICLISKEAVDIVDNFFVVGSPYEIGISPSTKAAIRESVNNIGNIGPDIFETTHLAVTNTLKTVFVNFQKQRKPSQSPAQATFPEMTVSTQSKISDNTSKKQDQTGPGPSWGDMITFSKLLTKAKPASGTGTTNSESDAQTKSNDSSKPYSESPTTSLVNQSFESGTITKKSIASDFKPTVLQVLDDELQPPFSLKDFHQFIINEHSEENYDFYTAVKEYQHLCQKIPSEALRDTSMTMDSNVSVKVDRARVAIEKIQEKFLTPGSDTELNIPSKILKPLLAELSTKTNIHPEIFKDALDNVLTMMRLSSFPVFCKLAATKGEPRLKASVQQVLDDLLPSPMSRKDFHDFLLREHSEENYEFYIALKKYEKLCEGIPREFLTDSQNVPHDDPQYPNIERAKEAMSNLITTFFITDGDFELNVPIRVKGPLLEEVQTKRNIHPEVFKDSLFTVLTMLRLSSFPNFQKEALRRSVAKLPDSAPVIPISRQLNLLYPRLLAVLYLGIQ
ncbi:regulator of G protein signaling superfamily [Rhizoclosmatium globosum]|uniref:Regulator of G protein signaling superfamily n=1 Tax=Rhizoclosmatium globosum TaxID=329046 RepID=A0A1Y2BNU8_9FUNG|nr:regulator of G protein signaling superfamily [Rhizoclosmatium globosum]|eukprot:ORY36429.1 regulator of G protein signaling superfamily [Rhizoclosmatium globosum]